MSWPAFLYVASVVLMGCVLIGSLFVSISETMARKGQIWAVLCRHFTKED